MSENSVRLEDIEALRARSSVSYEEAVVLLAKYDGDVTRALIELEKRGAVHKGVRLSMDGRTAETVKGVWQRGLSTRMTVSRDDRTLVDLPVVCWLLALLLGWRLILVGAVIALACGCRVQLRRGESVKKQEKSASSPSSADGAAKPDDGTPEPVETEPEERDDGYKSITVE